MQKISRKYFRKVCGGAVLFQVILGLGLMVMISPFILIQIKKYNDQIKVEEVVADLQALQKAASSYVVFERDNIESGIYLGDNLRQKLKDYLGAGVTIGKGGNTFENDFGQKYALVVKKNGEDIEAVIVAYGGDSDFDLLKLNTIGQFLFDSGAVARREGINQTLKLFTNMNVKEDGNEEEKVKLSDALSLSVSSLIGTGVGGIVMFVSDAFFASEFLHVAPLKGSTSSFVNTMIAGLDMGGCGEDGKGHCNLIGIKDFYAGQLNVENFADVDSFSVSKLTFNGSDESSEGEGDSDDGGLFVAQNFEYQNPSGVEGEELKVEPKEIEVGDLTLSSAVFDKVDIADGELETTKLSFNKCYVHGDATVNGWDDDTLIEKMYANNLITNGGASNDVLRSIVLDKSTVAQQGAGNVGLGGSATSDEYSYIYVKTEGSNPTGLILSLDGVSEVKDICFNGSCSDANKLSTMIYNAYTELNTALRKYSDWLSEKLTQSGESNGQ